LGSKPDNKIKSSLFAYRLWIREESYGQLRFGPFSLVYVQNGVLKSHLLLLMVLYGIRVDPAQIYLSNQKAKHENIIMDLKSSHLPLIHHLKKI